MSTTQEPRARSMVSWGLLDQVVASGTTFMFVVVAAHSVTPTELGAMALAFEFYLLSVMVARGLCGDPLTSTYSGALPDVLARAVRSAATTAVLAGVGLGVLLALGALLTEAPLRPVLLVAAVALPGLTLQDYVRSALIVQNRAQATFLNDTIWAVTQLPAMLVAAAVDGRPAVVLGAWAATGWVAALIGLVQLRTTLGGPGTARQWLRDNRALWPFYLTDNLVFQGAALLLMFIVSVTAGLTAMAGFRVAMTVYAPLSLIGRGVIMVAVALLARERDSPAHVRKQALVISTVLTPLALGWGLLTLLVPTSAGQKVFGDAWIEAEPVVFLASFVCASGLFAAGIAIGLRALSAGRATLTGRLVTSSLAAVAALVGGYLGAEVGLFLGLALCFPVQAVIWWFLLRRAARSAAAVPAASTGT